MKKALLLCLTLIAATFGFAQQQLATLNHNNSITVYYGASALQQAHAAAVNGDIITLSPGAFNSLRITKAVTIRGAGMYADTISRINSTIVNYEVEFDIPYDSLHHLIIEGIYFSSNVYYKKVFHPKFIKCYFQSFFYSYNNGIFNGDTNTLGSMYNATFVNSILTRWNNCNKARTTYNLAAWGAKNTTFVNSIILDIAENATSASSYFYYAFSSSPDILINSIVFVRDPDNIVYKSISNCIVYTTSTTFNTGTNNAFSTFYSIGINSKLGQQYFANAANHYNSNFNSMSAVFKTFRGTFTDGETFELQDSIASNYLGSDGTQVGIYGGFMPFDPRVSGLNIRRLDVARRTTADGKLAIDIEVVNEESTNTSEEE